MKGYPRQSIYVSSSACHQNFYVLAMRQNKILSIGRVIAPCHRLLGPGPKLKQREQERGRCIYMYIYIYIYIYIYLDGSKGKFPEENS